VGILVEGVEHVELLGGCPNERIKGNPKNSTPLQQLIHPLLGVSSLFLLSYNALKQ
tara:strand:- start:595 stop:762 length:168 start_codon:yes stop_codon:yes gene_type:complete